MTIIARQATSATWVQYCMLPGEMKWYMDKQVQYLLVVTLEQEHKRKIQYSVMAKTD